MWPGAKRLQDNLRQSRVLRDEFREAMARVQATREQILRGRSRRELLQDSAFARLAAKYQTMPVIEQAKGILMAQQECGPEDAFDLLRQASQRTNIKVHVLAAQIVGHVTSDGNGDNMAPISLGTSQVPEPGNTGPATRRAMMASRAAGPDRPA
jgi:hypothetical protein